ncbi:hypothetical protein [Antrihabitans stalactiti]|uniref:hypothetical protein n=1 Tax=Antrihabitans stalactiti TaxID=2584121 RepID=UPI0030B84A84
MLHPSRDDLPGSGSRSTSTANPFDAARRAAVQKVLDEWAAALRNDDADALPALFDERASAGFLDREVRRAHNLIGVPLADWAFEISAEPEVPVTPEVFDSLQASDVWAPAVYLRYAVAGPDAVSTRKPVSLTVARRGDTWKLVSDDAVGGRQTWRGPWDFGPLVAEKVPNGNGRESVVLGHPEQQSTIDSLAAELATAVSAVTELWGPDWAGAALVIAASDQEEFTELVGTEHSGTEIAAVSISDAVAKGTSVVSGQRIVFSPEAADRLTEVTLRTVLRHELTHVAARAATVDGSPLWMLEGFADYSGYRNSDLSFHQIAPTLTAQLQAGGPPTELPTDADFSSPDSARLAYEEGWSICSYVATRYGEQKLVALYRRIAQGPLDAAGLDRALREVLGIGTDQFVKGWGETLIGHMP